MGVFAGACEDADAGEKPLGSCPVPGDHWSERVVTFLISVKGLVIVARKVESSVPTVSGELCANCPSQSMLCSTGVKEIFFSSFFLIK